jgi:predicted PilT family ATPase
MTSLLNTKSKNKKNKHIKSKKKIEDKINTTIFNNELSYDLSVDDEFKSSLLERDLTIHMDIIKNLPTYKIEFKTKQDDDEHHQSVPNKNKKSRIDKKINTNTNTNNNDMTDNYDEEYIKTLTIDKVGNISYRFDYDKGIIFDLKMNEVGHIDDYGEICMIENNIEELHEEDNTEEQEEI